MLFNGVELEITEVLHVKYLHLHQCSILTEKFQYPEIEKLHYLETQKLP